MIFKKEFEETTIDVDAEKEKARDERIVNDIKKMMIQIESDIRLLNNTLDELEKKYGITD